MKTKCLVWRFHLCFALIHGLIMKTDDKRLISEDKIHLIIIMGLYFILRILKHYGHSSISLCLSTYLRNWHTRISNWHKSGSIVTGSDLLILLTLLTYNPSIGVFKNNVLLCVMKYEMKLPKKV